MYLVNFNLIYLSYLGSPTIFFSVRRIDCNTLAVVEHAFSSDSAHHIRFNRERCWPAKKNFVSRKLAEAIEIDCHL